MTHEVIPTEKSDHKHSLYERDYYTWAVEQARALKEHRFEDLNWENLADEVEGLAKTEKRELKGRLQVLLLHLLKWQFQPSRRSRNWRTTIVVQRREIQHHLQDNPGLRPYIADVLSRAYELAQLEISGRFLRKTAPQPASSSPWTFEQVMDEQFWPD
jgi:hypothetical protein